MITLQDSIRINRPPVIIFKWFNHFVENYKSWHPDHVNAKWVKGKKFEKGSILYAEEYFGGRLEKLSFKITNCIENELIEYKLSFPESIICSGGSFAIQPSGNESIFTATLTFPLGRLFLKIAKQRAEALRTHMKEEGENLKSLLENGEN